MYFSQGLFFRKNQTRHFGDGQPSSTIRIDVGSGRSEKNSRGIVDNNYVYDSSSLGSRSVIECKNSKTGSPQTIQIDSGNSRFFGIQPRAMDNLFGNHQSNVRKHSDTVIGRAAAAYNAV